MGNLTEITEKVEKVLTFGEDTESECKSDISDLLSKKKAFGFGEFKKRKSIESTTSKNNINKKMKINEDDKEVKSNVIFDPIESHRYFCPYYNQFNEIMKKLQYML